MGNMVKMYVKFNYERLHINKALGVFKKSDDNNNRNNSNVHNT